jgi:two-component system cell cycle sensor histidine kinase/response regulator CckA
VRADLLITDVVLAGLNGPTLVRELRRLRQLKVLFVSGYTNGEVVSRGLDEAADALLYKPFTLPQLAQTVRGVLEGQSS